jgi:hypothetical protein
LLDPTDVCIANSVANAQGAGCTSGSDQTSGGPTVFQPSGTASQSVVLVSDIQSYLGSNSVTVTTNNASGTGNGDLTVVDAVAWSATNTLALEADRHVAIKAPVTGLNGTLALRAHGGNISQTQPIVAGFVSAYADAGSVTLTSSANQAGTLAGYAGAGAGTGFRFANGQSLIVGTVSTVLGTVTGVSTALGAAVQLTTSVGDLDLREQLASGDTLALQAGGDILFNAPSALAISGTTGTATAGASGKVKQVQGTTTIDASLTVNKLQIEAGTLTGSGDIAVGTSLLWSGGTLAGSGAMNITNFNFDGRVTGAVSLSRRINLAGALILTAGAGQLNTSGNGTVLDVQFLGEVELQDGTSISGDDGTPETILLSNGGGVKSSGTPGNVNGVLIVNSGGGHVVVRSGYTLQLGAGVFPTNGGSISIASGGTLSTAAPLVSDGSITSSGTLSVAGPLLIGGRGDHAGCVRHGGPGRRDAHQQRHAECQRLPDDQRRAGYGHRHDRCERVRAFVHRRDQRERRRHREPRHGHSPDRERPRGVSRRRDVRHHPADRPGRTSQRRPHVSAGLHRDDRGLAARGAPDRAKPASTRDLGRFHPAPVPRLADRA